MKPMSPCYVLKTLRYRRFFLIIVVSNSLIYSQANAKFKLDDNDSANIIASEKKVDYLEQIYFSGGDKGSLRDQIDMTLADIQGRLPTKSLAKQATFLIDMKDNAEQASNACDILDLLAVGIYQIDPAEAIQQGVRRPTDKAKKKSVDAIGALDQLNSSTYNLSNTANSAAWESYMLSGGKYGNFAKGASKLGNAAGKAGATGRVIGEAAKTGKALKDVLGGIGIGRKKDKPCDDVTPKTIIIGEHTSIPDVSKVINTNTSSTVSNPIVAGSVPQTETPVMKKIAQSKITIKAVSASQLQSILSSVTKIVGVTSAESDSYSKNIVVLLIDGDLKVGELANKIVEACKPLKLTIDSYSNSSNSADLILKP